MKRFFILLSILIFIGHFFVFAESIHSPAWGFFLDLPEGYEFVEGDGRDRFSFAGPAGLMFDLVVYNNRFESIQDLVIDVNKKISNKGDADFFSYYDKKAAIIELDFDNYSGYGLCVELSGANTMMVALSYCPNNQNDLELFHLSALDSISPSVSERLRPGAIMAYAYPRGELKNISLQGGVPAMIYDKDAAAAQSLIEREFAVLSAYANTSLWQKAWYRYYRLIFRDSFDRVVNPAFALAHAYGGLEAANLTGASQADAKRAFAQRALNFVQGFAYERDLTGSDFLNLVTAVTERRGDCDSRAMLWAIILTCADIRAGMMVSRQYSHAMGLADLEGQGARFDAFGVRWLVAETTTDVELGLIMQDVSDPQHWIGIVFD